MAIQQQFMAQPSQIDECSPPTHRAVPSPEMLKHHNLIIQDNLGSARTQNLACQIFKKDKQSWYTN